MVLKATSTIKGSQRPLRMYNTKSKWCITKTIIWLGEKWENEKLGKEKGDENLIFYCLIGVKGNRKEHWVDGVFHLSLSFFLSKLGRISKVVLGVTPLLYRAHY